MLIQHTTRTSEDIWGCFPMRRSSDYDSNTPIHFIPDIMNFSANSGIQSKTDLGCSQVIKLEPGNSRANSPPPMMYVSSSDPWQHVRRVPSYDGTRPDSYKMVQILPLEQIIIITSYDA